MSEVKRASVAGSGTSRWRALAGLALSGAGELLTRAAGSPGWGALLLAVGGSCLALDAFRAPERPREEEPDRPVRRGIRPAVLMSIGAALACALAILRLFERDFESRGAVALWALALALVIGGGLLAGTWLRIPARWPAHSLRGGTRMRRILWAALILIVALGGAARVIGLSHVPNGINPAKARAPSSCLAAITRSGSKRSLAPATRVRPCSSARRIPAAPATPGAPQHGRSPAPCSRRPRHRREACWADSSFRVGLPSCGSKGRSRAADSTTKSGITSRTGPCGRARSESRAADVTNSGSS